MLIDGKKFKEIRDRARVSQEDLAAAAGVTAKTISRWETGEMPIVRFSTLDAIAKALGMDKNALGDLIEKKIDPGDGKTGLDAAKDK